MIAIRLGEMTLIFGSKNEALIPESCDNYSATSLKSHPVFAQLLAHQNCNTIVQLHQIHSAQGLVVSTQNQAVARAPRSYEGDFIITNQPNIALAIATADCLPLIAIDAKMNAVAIVHAGWRGLAAGIVKKVLRAMKTQYGSCPDDMEIFIGPAARNCCYEIQSDFLQKWSGDQDFSTAIFVSEKNDRLFFDLTGYAVKECTDIGIKKTNIFLEHNTCTLCSDVYCSARRQSTGERNVSLVFYQKQV